jgi:DNA-binding transcriptional LysR family regulator
MELRQLAHFVAVAEDGSFTKAARRLDYVQSALSVSVQQLERELGVRLFDRTTHRVALTSAGEALVPAARRTLAAAEETLDAAAAFKGVLRGTLRVGVTGAARAFIDVPGVLGRFHRQHPDVEIQIHPAVGSAALLDELRHGGLDIAFIAGTEPLSGVTAIPLGSEDLMLVAAPETTPGGRGPVPLESLANASFVDFPTGWGIRTAVDRAFAAAGLTRRVTIEVADVGTCVELVRVGLGVGLFPPSLFPAHDPHLPTRTISPRITWHVVMATPSGRTTAPAGALAALVTEAPALAQARTAPTPRPGADGGHRS